MKLTAKTRAGMTKGQTKQIRREGNIPAVFYSPGQPALSIEVEGVEFQTVLRSIKAGHLGTTPFTIEIDGKKKKALVKDIHYHVTSYDVIHLDFLELEEKNPVRVNVPIECIGVEECAGIKLGGALRQIIRSIRVECLPKDIPSGFELDVKELAMNQSKRLSDLPLPNGVRILKKADEVVAVIAKR